MALSARMRLPLMFRFPAIATSDSVESPNAMRPLSNLASAEIDEGLG